MIIFSLSKEILNDEIKKDKKEKAEASVINHVNRFYDRVYESLTTKLKSQATNNLLGETNYSKLGVIKEGFVFRPLNMNGLSKGVINTNIPKINYFIDWFDSTIFKPEFRKVSIKDLEKTRNDMLNHNYSNVPDLNFFKERYLGIDGLFVSFNYQKLLEYYEKKKFGNYLSGKLKKGSFILPF